MNIHERANFVRAMDTIVRAINDESYLNIWLSLGVADGDVDGTETDEELEFYVDDDAEFAELMDLFLYVIKPVRNNGGLYVDGVVSRKGE